MKKIIKRFSSILLRILPAQLRNELVRRSISLPEDIPSQLKFKIAETTEELEASFRLVYQVYMELGYCEKNDSKMRATVYHALPSTTTLVAVDQGKIVGTLTIVRDNRLGLPLEKTFRVAELRKHSNRLAEITSLVIHKDYRREKGGLILFPLLRLMYEYSTSYFGVNRLLVTIHPKNIDFYTSLLLFKTIPGNGTKNYLGAPAICLQLDLKKALLDYRNTYSRRAQCTNLFHFFIERKITNIHLPIRKFHKINDPLVNLFYFQEFFMKTLHLVEDRTERRSVESCLRQAEPKRVHPRIEVDAPGYFSDGIITIKDVSRSGFRAILKSKISIEDRIELQIEVAPKVFSKIEASLVWINSDYSAGFEVLRSDNNWNEFISFLYADQFGKTG